MREQRKYNMNSKYKFRILASLSFIERYLVIEYNLIKKGKALQNAKAHYKIS